MVPEFLVNTADTISIQKDMLRCHRTQKEWLDVTQGPDVYLKGIDESAEMCAKFSGKFTAAEGWIQHNHMGFAASADFNPLADALKENCVRNPSY